MPSTTNTTAVNNTWGTVYSTTTGGISAVSFSSTTGAWTAISSAAGMVYTSADGISWNVSLPIAFSKEKTKLELLKEKYFKDKQLELDFGDD